GAALVGLRLAFRGTQVTLRVVGVVELPVDDGGTGDSGVEGVRPAQHRQCGQVPAEGPSLDPHTGGVQAVETLGGVLQRGDLVLQDGTGQVEVDVLFPL